MPTFLDIVLPRVSLQLSRIIHLTFDSSSFSSFLLFNCTCAPGIAAIFHGEWLKPLQLERELSEGASGDALQQLGGLNYPAKLRDVVLHGVVVRAKQPVPVTEHDEYLL